MIKQIIKEITKHLNTPYDAPKIPSTTLINPFFLSFSASFLNKNTKKYRIITHDTKAIIVVKKLAYVFEMMSDNVRLVV